MKTIKVPFCDKLDINDFSSLECRMELQGAKSYISQVNWPSEYPYVPTVSFTIARNTTHLVILYHVRGLDLRAYALTDNEMVCHDSCCEFFVSDPYDSTYYNFEMNCIGTVKAAKRRSREDFELFDKDRIQRIIRHTSLKRGQVDETGMHSWQAAMCIPFELMGFTSNNIPLRMYANFYKCADKSGHPHFQSWNPVGTPQPDFHRPEYFGILEF